MELDQWKVSFDLRMLYNTSQKQKGKKGFSVNIPKKRRKEGYLFQVPKTIFLWGPREWKVAVSSVPKQNKNEVNEQ